MSIKKLSNFTFTHIPVGTVIKEINELFIEYTRPEKYFPVPLNISAITEAANKICSRWQYPEKNMQKTAKVPDMIQSLDIHQNIYTFQVILIIEKVMPWREYKQIGIIG